MFEADLGRNLYRLWNRLASGIVAWMLGALAAACVYFVLATALDLWAGVPCNGSRISVLYSALSQTENLGSALRVVIDNPYEDNPYGTVCVDRFGFDAILLALQTLSLVLCGAAGACVGRNPSAARGATGTFIGVAVYTVFMQISPDYLDLSFSIWWNSQ